MIETIMEAQSSTSEDIARQEAKQKLNEVFDVIDITFWELLQNQEPTLEIIVQRLEEAMRMCEINPEDVNELGKSLGYDPGGYINAHAQLVLNHLQKTRQSFGYVSLKQAVENHLTATRRRLK